jgi:hypothetical protein
MAQRDSPGVPDRAPPALTAALLGVTFVGPGVEELLHSATIAVAGQVPISRL